MQTNTLSAGPTSAVPQTRALMRCHAKPWELFRLYIVNLLLMVLTLGIYRFWAKTRMRRLVWSNLEILGDRLEYAGTGKELFYGFLVVFALILLPLFGGLAIADFLLIGVNEGLRALLASAQAFIVVFLIGAAVFRARRYRLTRTHWRGIYGGQVGSALVYGLIIMATYVLIGASLGLAYPACSLWLKRYEMRHTWVGDEQPEFTPNLNKLYRFFVVPWLVAAISIPVFLYFTISAFGYFETGTSQEYWIKMAWAFVLAYTAFLPVVLAFLWYQGKTYGHYVDSTRFHGHQLRSSFSGLGFAWLKFSNFLLILFTLGLGIPFTYVRVLRFVERKVSIVGDGDFSALLQSTQEKPTRGEGLADAFDIGGI